MEEFHEVEISEQDIAEYFYNRLIEKGYAPGSDEILDLAEIMFDFLLMTVLTEGDDF